MTHRSYKVSEITGWQSAERSVSRQRLYCDYFNNLFSRLTPSLACRYHLCQTNFQYYSQLNNIHTVGFSIIPYMSRVSIEISPIHYLLIVKVLQIWVKSPSVAHDKIVRRCIHQVSPERRISSPVFIQKGHSNDTQRGGGEFISVGCFRIWNRRS